MSKRALGRARHALHTCAKFYARPARLPTAARSFSVGVKVVVARSLLEPLTRPLLPRVVGAG
ncbi:MAG: hypothetical protein ACK58T_02080 [Phycisphaerae bacterium]